MAFRDIFGNIFYIPVYELLYRHLHNREINDSLSQVCFSRRPMSDIYFLSDLRTGTSRHSDNIFDLIATFPDHRRRYGGKHFMVFHLPC